MANKPKVALGGWDRGCLGSNGKTKRKERNIYITKAVEWSMCVFCIYDIVALLIWKFWIFLNILMESYRSKKHFDGRLVKLAFALKFVALDIE